MNLKDVLASGQQKAIGTLWCKSSNGPGLTTGTPQEQSDLISSLRRIADALEHHPETVCTLVLMAGVKATDDDGEEGVQSTHIVAGNAAGIAACHLQFEEEGTSAFKDCIPALLRDVLFHDDAEDEPTHPSEESAREQSNG